MSNCEFSISPISYQAKRYIQKNANLTIFILKISPKSVASEITDKFPEKAYTT